MTSISVGAKTRPSTKLSRNSDISEAQLVVDLTRRQAMKRMKNLMKKSATNNTKRRSGEPARRSRQPEPATFSIRQSTTTFGKLPAIETSRNPGYLFERSELEITPVRNIFREKLFSLRTFFGGGISGRQNPARRTDKASKMREKPWLKKSDPVSRLVEILTGKSDGMRRSLRRSKRDAEMPDATAEASTRHRDNRVAAANADPKLKRKYTPIFRECNHTASSEISDLNANPPLATGSQTAAFREIDYPRPAMRSLDVERERVESSKKMAEATPFSPLINGTYISLQDHQKETKGGGSSKDPNGYPLDIAPYNPDMIPYVDVPDYTDQREDSLDEDDRRVAKERYVDTDTDVIDPSALPRDDRRPQRIIVRDDYPDGGNGEDRKADDAEEDRKADDAEEDRKADDAEEDRKADYANEEDRKADYAEEDREDKLTQVAQDEARGDGTVEESDDATLKDEVGEKPAAPKAEEPPAVDFTPVHFDINEYRKPFNLEELFKEFGMTDEEEKKEASNKKESSEQQGSRNVPVHEPNQESRRVDDFPDFSSYGSPRDGKEGKRATRDENSGYYSNFDRIFGSPKSKPFAGFFYPLNGELKSGSEGERPVSYRDENTYERLFSPEEREDPYKAVDEFLSKDERSEEKESNEDEKENIEEDTDGERYAEASEEDQDESQQQIGKEEAPVYVEKELNEEILGPTYKELEKILEKKDDVSRLDPEVAENAKTKGLMPKTYKNYWSLEYETPKVSSKR